MPEEGIPENPALQNERSRRKNPSRFDQYRAAHEAVSELEGKLKKARDDEVAALTDDSAPEAKVGKRVPQGVKGKL